MRILKFWIKVDCYKWLSLYIDKDMKVFSRIHGIQDILISNVCIVKVGMSNIFNIKFLSLKFNFTSFVFLIQLKCIFYLTCCATGSRIDSIVLVWNTGILMICWWWLIHFIYNKMQDDTQYKLRQYDDVLLIEISDFLLFCAIVENFL